MRGVAHVVVIHRGIKPPDLLLGGSGVHNGH